MTNRDARWPWWRYAVGYGAVVVCIAMFAVMIVIGGDYHTSATLFTAVFMVDIFSGVLGLIVLLGLGDGWERGE